MYGAQAIGSSEKMIRRILKCHKRSANLKVAKYIIFKYVPADVGEKDFSKYGRKMFHKDSGNLVIKIVDSAHELAVERMGRYISAEVMRASNPIITIDSSESREIHDSESTSSTEISGRATPESSAPSDHDGSWPSVVLEVGVVKTVLKLKADVAWWLAQSKGQVNLVILIIINQFKPEITFETAVPDDEPQIRSTRSGRARYRPKTRQSIVVTRSQIDGTIKTTPNDAPLRVKFEEMFCHSPIALGGHDLEITIENLTALAKDVWAEQGFKFKCSD
ncbi:hypothetical protein N7456_011669 [Penicillium angulare]|uniref:Uncharacterized protein n=1 Tax=Penicillium angulare TaxID=116970 RepID=A0A9W9EU14_9EURO|nr:hypothetical protein N7456_011669 [Penicillium angulare]